MPAATTDRRICVGRIGPPCSAGDTRQAPQYRFRFRDELSNLRGCGHSPQSAARARQEPVRGVPLGGQGTTGIPLVPRELSRLVASCPRGQAAASWDAFFGKGSRPPKYPMPPRGCSATLSSMADDHIATRRAPDRSRRARIAVSVLGIVCCVIMTLTFQEKSLGLLFGLAFSLAWWSEVARRLRS
jgi:hypothetical protein